MSQTTFERFKYLTIIHVFHSFDQFNYRFNILIRSIPFDLTNQNIQKKFQCEETLRNQLYSLHLFNKETCYSVRLFILSQFSLLQFPHLRSLTLHKIIEDCHQ
ncbi:hypothetical protein I4U23_016660 [Adineta vaga]|nr:hypothetical protein I4U23_016660 [Adineta vaga]